MKKFLMMTAMLMASVTANAQQQGNMSVGGTLSYGISSDYKALGLGANFQYEFADKWRGEVAGNYFFPKDDFNVYDLNLNLHYLIVLGSKGNLYPLAGVTYMTQALSGDAKKAAKAWGADTTDSNFGFNVGLGIEYFVNDHFKVAAETKYQYAKDSDWPVLNWRIAYMF